MRTWHELPFRIFPSAQCFFWFLFWNKRRENVINYAKLRLTKRFNFYSCRPVQILLQIVQILMRRICPVCHSAIEFWLKPLFATKMRQNSGAKAIKLFSCSTQLSMKIFMLINLNFMLINLKLPTTANSFLLNLAEHEKFSANKYENANHCWEKFMLSWVEHEKDFITSEPGMEESILDT